MRMTRRRNGGELGGDLLALEATGILTQYAEPGGTTLVDARNGLNKIVHVAMLYTVRHCWTEGENLGSIATGIGCSFSFASLETHQSFS